MTGRCRMSIRAAKLFVVIAALLALPSAAHAQLFGTHVEATSCASAIGGSVNNSNISVVCGINPEVLEALRRSFTETVQANVRANEKIISLLEKNLDLNE